jgi:hypothetical protein
MRPFTQSLPVLLATLVLAAPAGAQEVTVASPGGRNRVMVEVREGRL